MASNSTIFTSTIENAQSQALAALKAGQRYYVDGVKAWAETVGRVVPAFPVPSFAGQSQVAEVIDNAFEFTVSVFNAQRDLATELVAAAAPLFSSTKAAASKSAPASAASKA